VRRRLGEELLSSDQLLELKGVPPLIEGPLRAKHSQRVTLRARARLTPQVGIHAFTKVTGSSLLGGGMPQLCEGGRIKRLLAIWRYGAHRGGSGWSGEELRGSHSHPSSSSSPTRWNT